MRKLMKHSALFFTILLLTACGVPSEANLGTPEDSTNETHEESTNHESEDEEP